MREPQSMEDVLAAMGAQNVGPGTFDTPLAHAFTSWTDADLYRAIGAPENSEPGPRRDAEIEEYVAELRRREAFRRVQAEYEEQLRAKYRI